MSRALAWAARSGLLPAAATLATMAAAPDTAPAAALVAVVWIAWKIAAVPTQTLAASRASSTTPPERGVGAGRPAGPPQHPDQPAPAADLAATPRWPELTAAISHELRTPLNAMLGFAELMQREVMGPIGHPRYREYLAHIQESGRLLLQSTETTLAATALIATTGRPSREVDLAALVATACAEVAPPATARGLDIALSTEARLMAAVEEAPLRHALASLLAEAIAQAPCDSGITIDARRCGSAARLLLSARSNGGGHRPGPSTALRVCLARALIERAGGTLTVREHPSGCHWQAVVLVELAPARCREGAQDGPLARAA